MTRRMLFALGAVGCCAAPVVALAQPLLAAPASHARHRSARQVGTLIMVTSTILDRHPGARRAARVGTGSAVDQGDVLTPSPGASARVVFTSAARKAKGTLFTLRAPHAATQQLQPGAAKLGPRLAFAYDGRYITTAAGRGLDAPTQLAARSAGHHTLRITFTAPSAQTPTFACSVDRSPFTKCTSPETLILSPGRHVIAVRTTSLFTFHGPATTRHLTVAR